jgi:Xaa-Pro aminopeptidase
MKQTKTPAYDPKQYPDKLVNFMMQNWSENTRAPNTKLSNAASFAFRRNGLSKQFKNETLVLASGHERVRSNDTYYRFRASSDFYYLTGCLDPECVLVMVPKKNGHQSILFLHENNGRKDHTFFTDRNRGELWVGPQQTLSDAEHTFGIETRDLSQLSGFLKGTKSILLRGHSASLDTSIPVHKMDALLASTLSEMRLYKDALEIKELQAVINSTKRGFEDVIACLASAKSEREVEGLFGLRARVEGNDVGYGTIAAAGAHACTLHWTKNNGLLKKNELLLLDAGVEGNQLYTADITRTIPIGGKFTNPQREIYDLVWKSQQAALKAVKPGNDFMEPNRAAQRVLAKGLELLGILKCSAEESMKDDAQFHKRYSLHNVSHMLGLDVHDCAKARQEVYRYGKLKPGMVLTVEPGLYFQMDDLTVPKKYRGIGIRIEDDVLVTETGMKNLSAHIPSEASAVEAWISKVQGR